MRQNVQILFLLVIPLKLKWVALISLLWPAYILVVGPLPVKMIVIMCLGNYLIFFGPSFLRRSREKRETRQRRAKFEASKDNSPTLHRCEAAVSPKPRTPMPTSAWPRMEKNTAQSIFPTKRSRRDKFNPDNARPAVLPVLR